MFPLCPHFFFIRVIPWYFFVADGTNKRTYLLGTELKKGIDSFYFTSLLHYLQPTNTQNFKRIGCILTEIHCPEVASRTGQACDMGFEVVTCITKTLFCL